MSESNLRQSSNQKYLPLTLQQLPFQVASRRRFQKLLSVLHSRQRVLQVLLQRRHPARVQRHQVLKRFPSILVKEWLLLVCQLLLVEELHRLKH